MQGGELRSSLPDARPTANRLVMPPDLSGRRAEVEGGEERPEIFPSERRQGGGCCGFPNAKSEERRTPKIFLLILKWGAAPFPAVFSPLLVPFGKGAIGPFGFQPLKRGLVPSAGAVFGKMTPMWGPLSVLIAGGGCTGVAFVGFSGIRLCRKNGTKSRPPCLSSQGKCWKTRKQRD